MRIPFLDLAGMHDPLRDQILQAIADVYDSNSLVLGRQVAAFEEDYADMHSQRFCVGTGNGLDALHFALKAVGVEEGDEVIVPSNTYIASVLAVSMCRAIPVMVEPRADTCNIDPDLIEQAITKKTKAILPVHLYGQSVEMDRVMEIATRHNLAVVEDNAQSHLATCNGQLTGTFGAINATSFYPGKNLGALGDGGAITTDNEQLAAVVRKLRNYGSEKKYYNEVKGFNSRLDEIQAAVLRVKLAYIAEWGEERRRLAALYDAHLLDCESVKRPVLAEGCTHVFHLYVVQVPNRSGLIEHLNKKEIGTLIHYPVPPHLQNAYRELGLKEGSYPVAERLAEECVSLPLYPGLSDAMVVEVCEQVKKFYRH